MAYNASGNRRPQITVTHDQLQNSESHPSQGALVVGGGHGALAIARSLGRRNIPVWVVVDELRLVLSSRYVRGHLRWPGPMAARERADFLVEMARRHGLEGWVLIPGSGAATELIALHREILAPVFKFSTSSVGVLREALDKRLSYALAERCDVDHPPTFYPRDGYDLMRLEVAFPAILKPSVQSGWNALIRAKAWKLRNRDEMLRRYGEARAMIDAESIMIQDFIPGGNEHQYSYAALCRDGEPLANLTARRLRQYPVEFGRTSSLVETIELPEVESEARRLLSELAFTGLVEVEFKRDLRDGKLKLLDINPRVWRWISLGARAGVDFPYLVYRMARGESIDAVRGVPGVRWMRTATDVPAAARELLRGATSIPAYLNSIKPPIEFSVLAADDLLPAILEWPHLLAASLRRWPFFKGRGISP